MIYIDRQLAGPYGRDKYRYAKPPFVESVPEHGYQGKASPREIYREGIKQLEDFASQPASEQDRRLHAIESTVFFRMLRQHTLEGLFSNARWQRGLDRMADHRLPRTPDELPRGD